MVAVIGPGGDTGRFNNFMSAGRADLYTVPARAAGTDFAI